METRSGSLLNGEFNALELEQNRERRLANITQTQFESMRDAFHESIKKENIGLNDIMLKKILLAYNMGSYSYDTDIVMELTDEEKAAIDNDSSLAGPFKVIQGKELEQLEFNFSDGVDAFITTLVESVFTSGNIGDKIEKWKEVWNKEFTQKNEIEEKYYLHTNGMLKFITTVTIDDKGTEDISDDVKKDVELLYYSEEVLQELVEIYMKKRDWENRDFAASLYEYLRTRCYTDSENTGSIKVYSYEEIHEKVIDWKFDDDDLIGDIVNRQLYSEDTDYQRINKFQDVEFNSLVTDYSTPVEFLVSLLEISSSPEFVDTFIGKIVEKNQKLVDNKKAMITLKLYPTQNMQEEKTIETINETTKAVLELAVGLQVRSGEIEYKYTEDGKEKTGVRAFTDAEKAQIEIDYDVSKAFLSTKVTIKLSNVPNSAKKVTVIMTGSGFDDYIVFDQSDKTGNGTYAKNNYEILKSSLIEKKNNCTIEQITRKATTITKYDMAIEEVDNWYEYVKADNDIQRTVETTSGGIDTRIKGPYYYDRSTANADIIFDNSKSRVDYTIEEIGNRIEDWYADLTSDKLSYYITGGPLTHNIYERFGSAPELSTVEECLNVKYAFARDEGLGDLYIQNHYKGVSMTCTQNNYKKEIIYTTVDMKLHKSMETPQENSDFFLSLLKNADGIYSYDAHYDADGKELEYERTDGRKARVAGNIQSAEEMLYELLETSPNTQGLVNKMKYLLNKYKSGHDNVEEWEFDDTFSGSGGGGGGFVHAGSGNARPNYDQIF